MDTERNDIPFLSLKEVTALHADELEQAVLRVVRSGWYLQGQENRLFEQEYASFVGTRHCVGCASGLDALTLIYRAYLEMGLMQPGDEVIVPAHTFIASVLAITENGLRPVLVDPHPGTLQLEAEAIEAAITPRTRSVMLVHLYGRCTYNEQIGQLCRKRGLLLVEDNAQAHGCRYGTQATGSLGHAAGHSFYPGKNLGAMGDGGAVTTSDEQLAMTVRTLANYGSQQKYVFRYAGRNSRLDELQAAVLRVKLRHLEADNAVRQQLADVYYNQLQHPLLTLPPRLEKEQNVYHLFPVFVGQGQRDALRTYLAEHGVGTVIHYPIPPHQQECYAQAAWNTPRPSLSVAERLAVQELSLPMSPAMTADEASLVARLVNRFKA